MKKIFNPIRKSLLSSVLFLFLFLPSLQSIATTTLVVQVPEPSFDASTRYTMDEIAPYTAPFVRGGPRPPRYRVNFDVPAANAKEFRLQFGSGSGVDRFFQREFIDTKEQLESELRAGLASNSSVLSVQRANIILDPLVVQIGVRGNKIELKIDGITADVRAKIRVPGGPGRILCGSSVTGTLKATISAVGSYDVFSGQAFIDSVDAKVSENVSCSNIIGRLLDPILEILADKLIGDEIEDLVASIAGTLVYTGEGFDTLLSNQQIATANRVLGFNVIEDAWDSISRYIDGFTFEITIGIDHFSAGNHLFGLAAFQEPVAIELGYETTFTCPSWATQMELYGTDIINTSRVARGVPRVYNYEFKRVPSTVTSQTVSLSRPLRRGSSVGSRDNKAFAASCKSANGLYSRPAAAAFVY